MSSQSTILLTLALGLAAVAGWCLWQDLNAPPPVPPPPPVEPLPADAESLPVPPPRPLPPDALRVRLSVEPHERFVPPPPLRVQAVRPGDGVELPTWPVAGVGAGFDTAASTAGVAMVRIDVDGGSIVRQVSLEAGATARPAIGAPLAVTGVVRDASGRPLSAVSVWFGEFAADGTRREVLTNQDGVYEAMVLASDGVPFVVSGRGQASTWRAITVAMPMAPCDAQMQPGCTLAVQLVAAAASMQAARVFVVPGANVTTGSAAWPYFQQALEDGVSLDQSGRAQLGGLPRGAEVAVLVRHPLAEGVAQVAVVCKGEQSQVLVPLKLCEASASGRVVDAGGQPLAGVWLWARPSGRALPAAVGKRLLPPHLDSLGAGFTYTDGEGAFVVGRPGGKDLVLSLRGRGFAGRDVPIGELDSGKPLLLPTWRGDEPQFEVAPPRAGTAWFAETDLSGGLRAELAADAHWRVSLPYAGRFRVELRTFVGAVGGEPLMLADVVVAGSVPLQPPAPR